MIWICLKMGNSKLPNAIAISMVKLLSHGTMDFGASILLKQTLRPFSSCDSQLFWDHPSGIIH